jgi:hypothetical protein
MRYVNWATQVPVGRPACCQSPTFTYHVYTAGLSVLHVWINGFWLCHDGSKNTQWTLPTSCISHILWITPGRVYNWLTVVGRHSKAPYQLITTPVERNLPWKPVSRACAGKEFPAFTLFAGAQHRIELTHYFSRVKVRFKHQTVNDFQPSVE